LDRAVLQKRSRLGKDARGPLGQLPDERLTSVSVRREKAHGVGHHHAALIHVGNVDARFRDARC